ncbi:MAG: hypothetical protein LBB11_01805 [Puniceicoccales bacterium]|nr:hypothetical protein [Puniceicoccales bacterium]
MSKILLNQQINAIEKRDLKDSSEILPKKQISAIKKRNQCIKVDPDDVNQCIKICSGYLEFYLRFDRNRCVWVIQLNTKNLFGWKKLWPYAETVFSDEDTPGNDKNEAPKDDSHAHQSIFYDKILKAINENNPKKLENLLKRRKNHRSFIECHPELVGIVFARLWLYTQKNTSDDHNATPETSPIKRISSKTNLREFVQNFKDSTLDQGNLSQNETEKYIKMLKLLAAFGYKVWSIQLLQCG